MDEVRRRVENVADVIARRSHPRIADSKEQDPERYRQFRRIFEPAARKELAREIEDEGLLDLAIADFRRAVRIAPAVGWYHLSLAQALSLKARMLVEGRDVEGLLKETDVEIDRTVYFTRNVPYMLFNAAHVLVTKATEAGGAEREAGIARAGSLLKQALLGAPGALGRKTFELLKSAGVDNRRIIDATPTTVRASRYLSEFFFARKDWADVLTALDRMEAAAEAERRDEAPVEETTPLGAASAKKTIGAPKEMPPLFYWSDEDHASVEFKLDIVRRRTAVLGYLGQWEGRRVAREKHAGLIDERVREIVAEARDQRSSVRYELALRSCRSALKLDPHDVDALIEMARATSVPHYRDLVPATYAPLACLFRAVSNSDSLTSRQAGEMLTLLASQRGLSDRDEFLVRLIKSAAIILQSGPGAAVGSRTTALLQLQKLATHLEDEAILWRQRHLVWHYLGIALEKQGKNGEAEQMYAKAVRLVPNLRRSVVALVRLARRRGDSQAAGRYAARVAALTPAHPSTVTFAGKLRLLGYSIVPADEAKGSPRSIRCYWEFLEPMPKGCLAQTYLLDYRWRIVRGDQRPIAPQVGAYPAEYARRGEVIVETRPLPRTLPNVRYVGFGVRTAKARKGHSPQLADETGDTLARFVFIGAAGK